MHLRRIHPLLAAWALFILATAAVAQEVRNLAGTGRPGFSGDHQPAVTATINNPYGIIRGPDRAIYFCDMDNHRIRRIGRDGRITTVAGTGQRGYSGDRGPAIAADLNEPYEIRFDRHGNLFVVEMRNHIVRRIDRRSGVITTVAGTGKEGFSGDGGPATLAALKQPHSIQFDRHGLLYICDIGNHRIRRVDLNTGTIVTYAGTGERKAAPNGAPIQGTPLNGPRALDFDRKGNIWLALREGNAVLQLDTRRGLIRHAAGTGKPGFTGNGGPATQATLSGPKGISCGPDGHVYFADTESHTIRRINTRTGTLDLVLGTGSRGDGPDGDPLRCALARPHGIFADAHGRLLVGDSEAHRIRSLQLPK